MLNIQVKMTFKIEMNKCSTAQSHTLDLCLCLSLSLPQTLLASLSCHASYCTVERTNSRTWLYLLCTRSVARAVARQTTSLNSCVTAILNTLGHFQISHISVTLLCERP